MKLRQAIRRAGGVTTPSFPFSTDFDSLYSGDFTLNAALTAVTQGALTKPAKNTFYTDVHGVKSRIVTQPSDSPDAGVTFMLHDYSRRQAYNANGTRRLAAATNGWAYVYNTATNAIVNAGRTLSPGVGAIDGTASDGEVHWHPTDPNKVRFTDNFGGLIYRERDLSTGVTSTLFNLGPKLAALGGAWTTVAKCWTKSEGRPSIDGRYYAFMCETAGNASHVGFIAYDSQTDTILWSQLCSNRPDHLSISPLGTHVVISWNGTAATLAADDAASWNTAIGVRSVKIADGTWQTLSVKGEHSDMVLDADGNQWFAWVSFHGDPGNGSWDGRGISDGNIALCRVDDRNTSFYYSNIDAFQGSTGTGFHLSGAAFDRRGWLVITKYPGVGSGPYDGQVIVAEVKASSPRIYRVGLHRSNVSDYNAEPHGTPNRDLTRILCKTDWSGGTTFHDLEFCLPSWAIPNS